jgi:hypothetical protein
MHRPVSTADPRRRQDEEEVSSEYRGSTPSALPAEPQGSLSCRSIEVLSDFGLPSVGGSCSSETVTQSRYSPCCAQPFLGSSYTCMEGLRAPSSEGPCAIGPPEMGNNRVAQKRGGVENEDGPPSHVLHTLQPRRHSGEVQLQCALIRIPRAANSGALLCQRATEAPA